MEGRRDGSERPGAGGGPGAGSTGRAPESSTLVFTAAILISIERNTSVCFPSESSTSSMGSKMPVLAPVSPETSTRHSPSNCLSPDLKPKTLIFRFFSRKVLSGV